MPSPFPGMDPYIEGNFQWHPFHNSMIIRMLDVLNDDLPEGYVATNEVRIIVPQDEDEESRPRRGQRLPDVSVARNPTNGSARSESTSSGGTAVATLPEPHVLSIPDLRPDEVGENYIDILRLRDRKVVTSIELLSLSNKSDDRAAYLRRRRVLLNTGISLVEIDLLLGGRRLPMRQALPAGQFYTFVTRAERLPQSDVYAWTLRDPLPTLPIPLRDSDADVPLDLAAIFRTTYDRGRYPLLLSYGDPLGRPFGDDDRAWAAGVLAESELVA